MVVRWAECKTRSQTPAANDRLQQTTAPVSQTDFGRAAKRDFARSSTCGCVYVWLLCVGQGVGRMYWLKESSAHRDKRNIVMTAQLSDRILVPPSGDTVQRGATYHGVGGMCWDGMAWDGMGLGGVRLGGLYGVPGGVGLHGVRSVGAGSGQAGSGRVGSG